MPKLKAVPSRTPKKNESAYQKGLEDVVAGESSICFIDGDRAKLLYRGYDVADLARNCTFEEAVHLLWFGALPNQKQYDDWTSKLAAARGLPSQLISLLKTFPTSSPPMSVLRTAASAMSLFDAQGEEMSREANLAKGIRLLAQSPTVVAAFERLRKGKEPIAPRKDLGLAGNFLYMLDGKVPDQESARALDAYFVLLADHELNASTFTARTTAATLSDLHSSVVSAIGALKGDLHGSANRRSMEMLLEIGEVKNTESYVQNLFAQKKKLMGFGHRVYTVRDPRAQPLSELAKKLSLKKGNSVWYEISERLEEVARKEKGLYCNVDLYSASVLYLCGIPVDMFTCMFACSRMAGWVGHVLEQYADNRLIRPRAIYTGPKDCKVIPLNKRK